MNKLLLNPINPQFSPSLDAFGCRAYHFAMLEELDQLAARVLQLASLTQQLREENNSLRFQLGESQGETRLLRSRLDAARARIETLIEKLPAS